MVESLEAARQIVQVALAEVGLGYLLFVGFMFLVALFGLGQNR